MNPTDREGDADDHRRRRRPVHRHGARRQTVSFGADAEPLRIVDLDTMPGATIEIHFQSGDGAGIKTQVPVLDGSLPYYADLVPTAEHAAPTPIPTDTAAPAPRSDPHHS